MIATPVGVLGDALHRASVAGGIGLGGACAQDVDKLRHPSRRSGGGATTAYVEAFAPTNGKKLT